MNGCGQGEAARFLIDAWQPILRWHRILERHADAPQAAELALLVHETRIAITLAGRRPLATRAHICSVQQAVNWHSGSQHLARTLDERIPIKAVAADVACAIGWLGGRERDEADHVGGQAGAAVGRARRVAAWMEGG